MTRTGSANGGFLFFVLEPNFRKEGSAKEWISDNKEHIENKSIKALRSSIVLDPLLFPCCTTGSRGYRMHSDMVDDE
jgi:hypothetical protein